MLKRLKREKREKKGQRRRKKSGIGGVRGKRDQSLKSRTDEDELETSGVPVSITIIIQGRQ